MYRTLSAVAALAMTAGTLAFAVPAHAAPAEEGFSISLEGLDSSDPAHAARIERRIRAAAQSHCGSNLIQPTGARVLAAACEQAVTAEARSAVQLAAARQSTPTRLALRVR
jgi:UrcA family protein